MARVYRVALSYLAYKPTNILRDGTGTLTKTHIVTFKALLRGETFYTLS